MSLLSVKNVGKAFRAYKSEWHRFANWFGLKIKPAEEHWVLRHINFEIHAGEAIGIIGQNGAGKSTLLKMITGTLQPTEGKIQINGRIAAILELGMGFDAELTGRQNVFHTAGLMGFSAEEIKQAMQGIEAFAEIGDYFDQSVRIYSSGMQARVAFAIATAFKPDILIVDEVLAVGDAAFQRKCFRRIEKYMSEGMALLLVTHDIESIKKLSTKALFLKDGSQYDYGDSKKVCDEYEQDLFGAKKVEPALTTKPNDATSGKYDDSFAPESEVIYGNNKAIINNCWIQDSNGEKVNVVETRSQLKWCFNVTFDIDTIRPFYNMQIKTSEGIVLFGVNSDFIGYKSKKITAGTVVNIEFRFINHLAPGLYFFDCGVKELNKEMEEVFLQRRVDSAILKVVGSANSSAARGIVDLDAQLSVSISDINKRS